MNAFDEEIGFEPGDNPVGFEAARDEETHEIRDQQLRPGTFDDYVGQPAAIRNLRVFVKGALQRCQPLDHVLLHGPPGLGKTTLARVVAAELGMPFQNAAGPAIERPRDLAGILAGIEPGCVLFVDEIHRLSIDVEEILYSAMEDFAIDMIVGQGPAARAVRVPVPPFTLIGATTRAASLSKPLLSRFGIVERLRYYEDETLAAIIERSAGLWGIKLSATSALELARRSRGVPRIANRLLRRVRDFADFQGHTAVGPELVELALTQLGIDRRGLDDMDRSILTGLWERYRGGPVGLDTLAATLGEDKATIAEVYEPFLVAKGLIARSPRGRVLTPLGLRHLQNRDPS